MGPTPSQSSTTMVDQQYPFRSPDLIWDQVGHGVLQPFNVKRPLVNRLSFNLFSDLLHELSSPSICTITHPLICEFLDPKQISLCLSDQNRSKQASLPSHRSPFTILIQNHCMSTCLNHNAITIILVNHLVN
eukprot:TRINITY_DN6322_c1_g1_i2.p1 TRINITY_DN6322_c1_g1~~TRINITY_DN6322_c1_g1_i2.p1  ORF type:complete len:132 (-),score=3.58 TRINITY_DN6322_c1_g1_i2:89-484(-)